MFLGIEDMFQIGSLPPPMMESELEQKQVHWYNPSDSSIHSGP